ncbi:MAG: Nuclear control of ATPase protein 2 [Peltula sp. TS41687]|nr:MAG: Nuclear control of ATPase protein 2 [Peltula sp. TS41687]
MSFVLDQVRRIDSQLDRLQLLASTPRPTSPEESVGAGRESGFSRTEDVQLQRISSQLSRLQSTVKSLSTTSSARALLEPHRISHLLSHVDLLSLEDDTEQVAENGSDDSYEELQWLLIGKAAVQTYGVILNTLLEQTIPLSDEIWYWDEVLGSYQYTALYSIQTAPLRLWDWSKCIYADSRTRLRLLREREDETSAAEVDTSSVEPISRSLIRRWNQFYGLVRESIHARSVVDIRRRVVSPFALSRAEARSKQQGLKKLREMSASGLGVLMDECLRFDVDEEGSISTKGGNVMSGAGDPGREEWKSIVEKSVTLMETVMRNVTRLDVGLAEFEDAVFASVEDESAIVEQSIISEDRRISRQAILVRRIQLILDMHVPRQVLEFRKLARRYGRPPVLIRYWLPVAATLLFSGTLLRIVTNRKAAITTWLREVGETVVDFWANWVVEPLKKLIGTIRHDEASEVALMSKESLNVDRASLERMVVQFAIDNPEVVSGSSLSEADIAVIREKVRQGDLTPVLRAYERDLRKPIVGTIRGDLIRALLIQIQKTKVDVEVAISGIDSLLKSQQLVFGFVGLTPSILVCLAVARWLSGLSSNRKGLERGNRQGHMLRLLRNVDRIVAGSTSANNGVLSYKEHGLLLCQVHELRQHAKRILPGEIYREFLEDIHELEDIRIGVDKQLRVVERIRWAYARWIR